jgi:ketosteroid isomerase-like protein
VATAIQYRRGTIEPVNASAGPPGRAVLRLAGILTQLICAACLLLGTIALVLVQQNKTGGMAYVGAWVGAALVGLVFGGLMGRGGMISLIACAVIDATFGIVLLALDHQVLRGLVRVLPASDVDMIAGILVGAGVTLLAASALSLVAIPQALRYARWLVAEAKREEDEAQPQPPRRATSQMQYTLSQHSGLSVRPSPNNLDPVIPSSASTARGWAPNTAKLSVWNMPAASPEEKRSRRRLYFALAGFAIGFGAGIGVLVSSAAKKTKQTADVVATTPDARIAEAPRNPASADSDARVAPDAESPVGEGGAKEDLPSIQMLIQDQRVAIANADPKALVATLAQSAVGFGIDADEVGEGRDALAKFIERDLGELPDAGFTVDSKFQTYGEAQNHAWIALEIEVSAPGRATRHIAITELVVAMDKKWQVVAWQWAVPVPDATAEKLAILGTLPAPKSITDMNLAPKEVESAVRAAFASRAAFADARSERADGFNFGSAPGERIIGGTAIKKLFGRIKAEIKVHDGMRIASGDMWDPAQKGAPYIAYAIANVDFTTRTRAATDLTQTFRVLAVLLKEGSEWKIVQTQWSHGGPIR